MCRNDCETKGEGGFGEFDFPDFAAAGFDLGGGVCDFGFCDFIGFCLDDAGQGFVVYEREGTVFEFASGVAFALDVGELFYFHGGFESGESVETLAEEEHARGIFVFFGEFCDFDAFGDYRAGVHGEEGEGGFGE